ncbi:low molecular weight protein arginine phosphatase [Alkalihalophilus sp. As8PL]|uniref:Low molecular weight protein arginine phosphatase n=1 Tax=Alkalihalophilus sp. As8PL TaxID=3237103 RepID=A0AB39BPS7_9BACI
MSIKNILFVCTGNTCRSPLAEALLRHRMGTEIEVKSAGVHAFPGSPASEGTRLVLEDKGIQHSHQSQPVTNDLLEWADVILTMTSGHKELVSSQFSEYQDKVHTLKEYVGIPSQRADISDPFGGLYEEYVRTADDIEECLDALEKQLKKS